MDYLHWILLTLVVLFAVEAWRWERLYREALRNHMEFFRLVATEFVRLSRERDAK